LRPDSIGAGHDAAPILANDSNQDVTPGPAAAFGFYGLCGDLSIKISNKPGSFFVVFIDTLYSIQQQDIDTLLKVDIVQQTK